MLTQEMTVYIYLSITGNSVKADAYPLAAKSVSGKLLLIYNYSGLDVSARKSRARIHKIALSYAVIVWQSNVAPRCMLRPVVIRILPILAKIDYPTRISRF